MPKKQSLVSLDPAINSGDVVASTVVEQVVRRINELHEQSSLDLALKVGELVVEHFYRGDLELYRKRGPKDVSLRALEDHSELRISKSSLHRSVQLYEMCKRLDVPALGQLTLSHLALLLPLPGAEQKALLEKAASKSVCLNRCLKSLGC